MTDTKHTPTNGMRLPLTYDGHYVYDADGNQVALHQHNSHIVKCVNMHEELVEALKMVKANLEEAGNLFEDGKNEEAWEWTIAGINYSRETLKKAGAL